MEDESKNDSFVDEMANQGVERVQFAVSTRNVRPPTDPTPGQVHRKRIIADAEQDRKRTNYLTIPSIDEVRVHPDDVLSWCSDGCQPGVFLRLKQGGYESQLTLDLHMIRVSEARHQLFSFISRCQQEDVRTATVVHGFGRKSRPPARMKGYVAHWLREHDTVTAFHSVPTKSGASPAVFVKIKKSRRASQDNRERFGLK